MNRVVGVESPDPAAEQNAAPGTREKHSAPKLRVGDWVEVRSKAQILQTLDSRGRLDGMPFMPEMFSYCGRQFQVYKRAHKTCDTVFPVRGRRIDRTVHLETRCDGQAHDGCQAGCLLFWKEAWLKPIRKPSSGAHHQDPRPPDHSPCPTGCTEAQVLAATRSDNPNGGPPLYVCQATQLPYATSRLHWWELDQYIEDYTSGNVGLWRIIAGGVYSLFYNVSRRRGRIGRLMRMFYDKFYPLWRGTPFPRKTGIIPEGAPTPSVTLSLQPGELVRIKSHDEILKTLNTRSRNRGLYFDAEEVPYCGGTYRVLRRVDRIVNEKTGHMLEFKTPAVILDSVVCQSRFSDCRMFCPRSIYSYWREIWLERVTPSNSTAPNRQ